MGNDNALDEAAVSTMTGFGAGVTVNVLFGIANGTITVGTPITTVISGVLVLAFTALGFGIGLMHGRKKDRAEAKIEEAEIAAATAARLAEIKNPPKSA